MQARYAEEIPDADVRWHRRWRAGRTRRGVGVTGCYVYSAGPNPTSGRLTFIDAEDPQLSNWTRFINHSYRWPNLEDEVSWPEDAEARNAEEKPPIVSFRAIVDISPGEELLFDYGRSFFKADHGVVD